MTQINSPILAVSAASIDRAAAQTTEEHSRTFADVLKAEVDADSPELMIEAELVLPGEAELTADPEKGREVDSDIALPTDEEETDKTMLFEPADEVDSVIGLSLPLPPDVRELVHVPSEPANELRRSTIRVSQPDVIPKPPNTQEVEPVLPLTPPLKTDGAAAAATSKAVEAALASLPQPTTNVPPAAIVTPQVEQPRTTRGSSHDEKTARVGTLQQVPTLLTAPPPNVGLATHPSLTIVPPIDIEGNFSTAEELTQFQSLTMSAIGQSRSVAVHPYQAHAPHVAQQVATATIQSQSGTTQIALNPEELGRVRMSLTTVESGVTVSIIAERPETADLMRRNMDLLTREFHDLGYTSVSFTFGEHPENAGQSPDDSAPKERGTKQEMPDTIVAPSITTVALRAGLDLKL